MNFEYEQSKVPNSIHSEES